MTSKERSQQVLMLTIKCAWQLPARYRAYKIFVYYVTFLIILESKVPPNRLLTDKSTDPC